MRRRGAARRKKTTVANLAGGSALQLDGGIWWGRDGSVAACGALLDASPSRHATAANPPHILSATSTLPPDASVWPSPTPRAPTPTPPTRRRLFATAGTTLVVAMPAEQVFQVVVRPRHVRRRVAAEQSGPVALRHLHEVPQLVSHLRSSAVCAAAWRIWLRICDSRRRTCRAGGFALFSSNRATRLTQPYARPHRRPQRRRLLQALAAATAAAASILSADVPPRPATRSRLAAICSRRSCSFNPEADQRRSPVVGQGGTHRRAVAAHDLRLHVVFLLRLPLDRPDAADTLFQLFLGVAVGLVDRLGRLTQVVEVAQTGAARRARSGPPPCGSCPGRRR